MPAKSKSQQRFFGMVDAYKKGELKNASKSIKDAAEGMSSKEVKKFAKTKHKGLPEKVKHKKKVNENINSYEEELMQLVNGCPTSLYDLMDNPRNGDLKDTCIYMGRKWNKEPRDVYNDFVNAFKEKEGNQINENVKRITESDLRKMVMESVKKYLQMI